jgi:hypothetical protein
MLRHACRTGLEGVVSKWLSAPYRSGPSRDWLKVENPGSPAMVRHREVEARWMKSKLSRRMSCRSWFQSHPEIVDRLESVVTKFYFAGEGPEWQAIWDQVYAVLERKTDTPGP